MPFINTFTEANRDKHFAEKIISAELPGILAWAVKRLSPLAAGRLEEPDYVKRRSQSTRQRWTRLPTSLKNAVRSPIRTVFPIKCCGRPMMSGVMENGEYALTQRPFSQKLLERGFTKRRNAAGVFEWYGFRLRGSASGL